MVDENSTISKEELAVEKNNEGVSRFKVGDWAGAARAFHAALELNPALDEARENRDMAIKRLGYDPLVEDRQPKRKKKKDEFTIDEGGQWMDNIIQYTMYAIAAVIGVALLVGMWAMLEWFGIITLVGTALIIWGIKWSWLYLIR